MTLMLSAPFPLGEGLGMRGNKAMPTQSRQEESLPMRRLFIQFYLLLMGCFALAILLIGLVYQVSAERAGIATWSG